MNSPSISHTTPIKVEAYLVQDGNMVDPTTRKTIGVFDSCNAFIGRSVLAEAIDATETTKAEVSNIELVNKVNTSTSSSMIKTASKVAVSFYLMFSSANFFTTRPTEEHMNAIRDKMQDNLEKTLEKVEFNYKKITKENDPLKRKEYIKGKIEKVLRKEIQRQAQLHFLAPPTKEQEDACLKKLYYKKDDLLPAMAVMLAKQTSPRALFEKDYYKNLFQGIINSTSNLQMFEHIQTEDFKEEGNKGILTEGHDLPTAHEEGEAPPPPHDPRSEKERPFQDGNGN